MRLRWLLSAALLLPAASPRAAEGDLILDEARGFSLRKLADPKEASDWIFEADPGPGIALLVRHAEVMGLGITVRCLRCGQAKAKDLKEEVAGVEAAVRGSRLDGKAPQAGKKRSRWFSGEKDYEWNVVIETPTNDIFENRIYLWLSKANSSVYRVDVSLVKGDWDRYRPQIERMLGSFATFPLKGK